MTLPELKQLAAAVVEELTRRGQTLAVAESLTGGMLSSLIVGVPGASLAYKGAVVSYAADVKVSVLQVDGRLVAEQGTVNETVSAQMAIGVAQLLSSDFALSTTGVAGPGPSEGKPAGSVFLTCLTPQGLRIRQLSLVGDRELIRERATRQALLLLSEILELPR